MIAGFLIVAGALLAFIVQPMAAKALLPTFGGAATVWTTALLFFQVALLGGYLYARQVPRPVHLAVLAVAVLATGVPRPVPSPNPAWGVITTLAASIGLPFLVLAATSPLWQRWLGGPLPYRYYALSNAASLLAVLAYPVLIEPAAGLDTQFRLWRWSFAAFAVLSAVATLRAPAMPPPSLTWSFRPLWIAPAAIGTLLLGATTSLLCQEVAPVPFLWMLPLAIYLASFVIVFDKPHWYRRGALAIALGILIPAAALLAVVGLRVDFWIHLAVSSATLLASLLLCHGELAANRPDPAQLGTFYVAISLGGALGGALVSLAAPNLFTSYAELPLALAATAALGLYTLWSSPPSPITRLQRAALAMAFFTPLATLLPTKADTTTLAQTRNFYGVVRVTEAGGLRKLSHGATTHGRQFADPARALLPVSYYGPSSGAGLTICNHPARGVRPMRIGIIGLGTGTLAAYGQPGDTYTFYELNPAVEQLARRHFRYLGDSPATTQVRIGDGRLLLAAETPQNFDILFLDAFSSDSIPVHLLTAEAAAVYQRHIASDGRIALHISNVTLNLEPVARGLAESIGWQATTIDSSGDPANAIDPAQWMILVRSTRATSKPTSVRWTDRYAALWPLWKFSALPH